MAAMATINSKILVGRQHYRVCKSLGHANEACIGETHGNIGILLDQLCDRTDILTERKGNNQSDAPEKGA